MVVGRWTVTPKVMRDFLDTGRDPASWDVQEPDGLNPADYGDEIARDGLPLNDEAWWKRVAFFSRKQTL